MHKTYKLIKDLPDIKSGNLLIPIVNANQEVYYIFTREAIKSSTNYIGGYKYPLKFIQDNVEWFKEIDWIITDPSCNQMMLQINETTFIFKENRINPLTQNNYVYEAEIDINEYNTIEIKEVLESYGYKYNEEFDKALIAECIFEQEYNYE